MRENLLIINLKLILIVTGNVILELTAELYTLGDGDDEKERDHQNQFVDSVATFGHCSLTLFLLSKNFLIFGW